MFAIWSSLVIGLRSTRVERQLVLHCLPIPGNGAHAEAPKT